MPRHESAVAMGSFWVGGVGGSSALPPPLTRLYRPPLALGMRRLRHYGPRAHALYRVAWYGVANREIWPSRSWEMPRQESAVAMGSFWVSRANKRLSV
jgi:hypothetical protein